MLCQLSVAHPTVVSSELWPVINLHKSSKRHARGTGLLEGGLLTIALFTLVIAITNREWIYLLLSAWLLGNLRLGAYAMGWDTQWLGYLIPLEWMPQIRQLTIASYYLLTYTLFTQLFRNNYRLNYPRLLRTAQMAGLVLLVGALVLPQDAFQPLMWVITAFGISVVAFLLSRVLYRNRSRIWLWHIVSLSMALCVLLSGASLAFFGRTDFLDIFNSVIALLLSSVMVALAVAERIREERNERLRVQTELIGNYAISPVGLFTLDSDGVFLRANQVTEQMLGFSMNDDPAPVWTDYFPDQNWHILAKKTLSGVDIDIDRHCPVSDPTLPKHFVIRVAMANGQIEGSLQDVTARTEIIQKLRNQLDQDPLTEVLNRTGIEKALDESLGKIPDGEPCALAYLDLDHFKRINGMFGHTAGDEVLKQVCQRIKIALTEQQQLGRIGGDEFIILFPNASASEVEPAAQEIAASLNTVSFQVDGRAFHMRAAVGVIDINSQMLAKDAISAASRACRDARKQHADVMVYEHNSPELLEHHEELRLFDQLEGGDSPRGLYLEMQPIMSLHRPLDTMDFEVLLRVRDSNGTLIPTNRIVSAAETSGTITTIDKWVFLATLEWLAKHDSRLNKTQLVSINLSGVSLNDEKFMESLFGILATYGHLARRLLVEITEGVALQDLNRTRRLMGRLQAMGIRIALDDFGAGYTSFSYLKELPADAIKIDGALIKDMLANETNTAIVKAIVELARNLGMKVIAEWVEDCATLQALQDLGVDYAQGWVISRAQAPADILNARTVNDLIMNPETSEFISRAQQSVHQKAWPKHKVPLPTRPANV
ncbi:EAL domain-containing protein [Alcaligenaceae bacterium]|nr:EAL domain-containing protein [Alcaligenaceae bacterium]